ncbi:condensation domain-containing protein [Actinophytocola xanthii]|uniref:Carrier domain-containing protein n=1 Tax=Actinophytocola xanthii TaxID=1912961 RepID=A0A1Q8CK17_9PSEU|nr:condensation domain-containing protein [Actinophytocola xanthii]OLF14707.1 hypothetical protein BU204_25800 [Actinophytocola xanthii]
MTAGPPPPDLAATVRRAWQELLRASTVTGRDDFFALGGHSMLASRLMSRLRRELGSGLPVGLIFEHPVFGDFVDQVRVCLAGATDRSGPVATDRQTGPVSAQQEELLRVEAVLGPSPVHNVVVAVEVTPRVEPELLRRALHRVVNRHPGLRLRFSDDGQQVVGPPLALSEVVFEVVEGASSPAAVRTAVRRRHLRPHDLTSGNLVRAQLFRSEQRDLLVLHLHHLSVDGVSQAVLLDDLSTACRELRDGIDPVPPEKGPSYLDYARWQRAHLDDLVARSRQHWRRVVGDLTRDRAPGGPAGRATRCRREVLTLAPETTARLRRWTRADGVTDFVAFSSVVAHGLSRVTGRARIGLGTLVDNRTLAGLERTIGPFGTSTLLVADVAGASTPRELVRAVRSELVAARRWAAAPLGAMLDGPCAELGFEPGDLVDVVTTLEQPYRSEPGASPTLVQVSDEGEPLVDTIVGASLTVALHVAENGAVRVGVEAADDHRPGAAAVAGAISAAARDFAVADHPFAPSEVALP